VTLFASRNPASYQVSGKPACGTESSGSGGCVPFIQVAGANAGIEGRQNSSGSQGIIDGRGDQTILGTSTTWFGLASQAKADSLRQQNPRLIQANNSNNFTLYHIDLINAANFHVVFSGSGFTAWGIRIKTPDNAGNTDGIDPTGTNVTVTNSYIEDGDDGIAIKGGSASSNMTITNNHFYGTHGISIGSETNGGVNNILFANNTLTGTDSFGTTSGSATGIRIKSSQVNGGLVSNVEYDNTCMTAVKAPIVFNTHYSTSSGSSIPTFTGIIIDGASAVNPPSSTKSTFDGYDSSHLLGLTMWNVSLASTSNTADNANIRVFNSNIHPSGTGVTLTSVSGTGSVPSCSFPSFPAL
jgi:polygalacturonase